MKFSKLTVAITGVLSIGATIDANAEHAIQLYMNSKTKQIYAAPCTHCVPLGSFERVDDKNKDTDTVSKGEEDFADVAKMHQDLETQHNEIKALEEHVAEAEKVKATMDKSGFQIQSADKNFKFKLGGRLQADATFHGGDGGNRYLNTSGLAADANDGTEVRRVRMRFEGVFYKDWLVRTEADFAGNAIAMKDAYIQYLGYKPITVTLGQQKQNYSRELQESSNDMMFTERSLMNILAAPVVDRAMGLNLEHFGGDLTAKLGVFGNSITPPTSATFADEGWGASTRITYAPINEKTKLIHLGVAGNFRVPDDNGAVLYSPTPLALTYKPTNMSAYNVINASVGNINDIKMLGFEGVGMYGPWSIGGEYTRTWIDRNKGSNNIELDAWYAEAAWSITGESRRYKDGNMRYLEPANPFSFSKGGWGAWELAARYSEADLSELDSPFTPSVSGGQLSNVTVALNWHLNSNVRFMLDYMRILDTKNAAMKTLTGNDLEDLDVFTLRGQMAF